MSTGNSPKSNILHEQWKLLSREYHSRDGDLADKDVFVQQRINSLKKWKTEALLQLRILFDKLKLAVPVTELDEVSRQLNIQRLKNNTMQEKQMQLNAQILDLQKRANKSKEDAMDLQLSQEIKRNLEQEIEILTKRLERHDPIFKWENQIFSKIAQIFIRAKVRPDQVFAEFDKNGDGILQKSEFCKVLDKVLERATGESLSAHEIDVLWEALDVNRNQLVDAKEFAFKLERFGLKIHTREEHIIYQLIEAVQRSTSIKDVSTFFQLIDTKGRGFITREDFADLFLNAKLKIDEKELTHFMNQFWKDDKAGIDYEGFLRIFKKYQVKLENDNKSKQAGKYVPISEETLRLKKHYFDEIKEVLKQSNKTLKDVFRKIDGDHNNDINQEELFKMFQGMRLEMTRAQSDQIFSSMDFDRSGTLSLPEIQADVQKVCGKNIEDLIYEQKTVQRMQAAEQKDKMSLDYGIDHILKGEHKTSQLMTRIEILTAKNTSMQKRLETQEKIKRNIEENARSSEQQYLDLAQSNEDLLVQKIEYQEEIDILKVRANNTISKEGYQQLLMEREKLIEDLTSTRAAMLSYKKMTEVIAEQAKNLKFMHERKKDEHENLLQALREMQAESSTKDRIGKLYFIIMLSRWQEAAVNKKYGLILNEVKSLRGELLSSDAHNTQLTSACNGRDEELNKQEVALSKFKQQVESLRAVYITQGKADELARNYQVMCEDRTDLEIKLMKARDELRDGQDQIEGLTVAKVTAEMLYQDLRHGQNEDIVKRLIDMSNNFQAMKLKEYRNERATVDLNQKVEYYTRLLSQRNEAIFVLEEKAAQSEALTIKEREEFRQRDGQRVKDLFTYSRYQANQNESSLLDPFTARTQGRQNTSINDQLDFAVKRTDGQVGRLGPDQLQRDMELKKMDEKSIYQRQFTADWTKSHIQEDGATTNRRVTQLESQIQALQQQLNHKQIEIETMGKWQFGDQYLSQDDQLKDKIDEYKARMSEHQEKDAQEMADAAYQTVQTLQNLLEQKKELLKSKDLHMARLREQMEEQRNIDADVISKLREQIAITGNSTLSKLHQTATRMEAQTNHSTQGQRKANADLNIHDRKARDQLTQELDKKDRIIKKLELQINSRETSLQDVASKLSDKNRQIDELKAETLKLRDRSDLDRATAARQKLMGQIKQRDSQIVNLQKAIDSFKDKMIEYETKEVDHHEETVILEKKDKLEIKKLKEDLELEIKLKKKAIETKNTQLEECTRLKSQIDKLTDELKNDKITDVDKDKKLKDLQTMLETKDKNLNTAESKLKELRSKTDQTGKSTVESYEKLEGRNAQLEKEVRRLTATQHPVICHNKEFGTFEFIGQPMKLDYPKLTSADSQTIYDVVEAIQAWLKENDRITYGLIFKSLDRGNLGDLQEEQFIQAFKRIGIALTPTEIKLLQAKLDLHNNRLFEISPLIRVLGGVPTKQFLPTSLLNLAQQVMALDLNKDMFKKRIDSMNFLNLDVDAFKKALKDNFTSSDSTFDSSYKPTDREMEEVFSFVTKAPHSKFVTTKISIDTLADQVMFAVSAIIIEAVRQALRRKQVYLIDLLHKHDADKDGNYFKKLDLIYQSYSRDAQSIRRETLASGVNHTSLPPFFQGSKHQPMLYGIDGNLTLPEVENFLAQLALDVTLKEKTQERFFKEVLDKANKKRVSCEQMKYIFGEDSTVIVQSQVLDLEPSRDNKKSVGATGRNHPANRVSDQQYEICRTAARKILNGYQSRFIDEMNKLDPTQSGLVSCQDVQTTINNKNISDLQPSELKQLIDYCDGASHGALVLNVFEKKLTDMAKETDKEKLMRKFATEVQKLSTALESVLQIKDPHRTGMLDYPRFKNALQSLNMQLTDPDIKSLHEEGRLQGSTNLNIQNFVTKVAQVSRTPPLSYTAKPVANKTQTRFNTQQDAPEENTLRFKKSIEALKLEIEEKNREIKSLNQAITDSSKRVLSLENEIKKMENRLVDKHAKPPHEMQKESTTQGALDQIQSLKDEIHHVQNVNQALQKTIQVDLKSELSKVAQEKEEIEEKYKLLREQFNNKRLEIERMTGTGGGDPISRRETALETRQRRIEELEGELEQIDDRNKMLQDQLFIQQEKVLDLKFEKETFDLQYARLQKRNTDLEQYKMQSASLSAALKGKHEEELAIIKDQSTKLTGDQLAQKPGESVKMRNKPSKSVQELELVIEMLRRVQDKQKVEIDALKRTNERLTTANAKVGNADQLNVTIKQLERVVHSYEMRDVNLGEQDVTIKKLIFANKQLREDMTREIERYNLLEAKYRDLLVKNNILGRENESNKEFVFQMQTGAHMSKFTNFLNDPETPPKNELDTKGFTGFRSTKESGMNKNIGLDDSLNKINRDMF